LEPQIETFGLTDNRRLAQLKLEKAYALFKRGKRLEAKRNFDDSIKIMGGFSDEWDTARREETGRLLGVGNVPYQ
jgi:hypothetical protein